MRRSVRGWGVGRASRSGPAPTNGAVWGRHLRDAEGPGRQRDQLLGGVWSTGWRGHVGRWEQRTEGAHWAPVEPCCRAQAPARTPRWTPTPCGCPPVPAPSALSPPCYMRAGWAAAPSQVRAAGPGFARRGRFQSRVPPRLLRPPHLGAPLSCNPTRCRCLAHAPLSRAAGAAVHFAQPNDGLPHDRPPPRRAARAVLRRLLPVHVRGGGRASRHRLQVEVVRQLTHGTRTHARVGPKCPAPGCVPIHE